MSEKRNQPHPAQKPGTVASRSRRRRSAVFRSDSRTGVAIHRSRDTTFNITAAWAHHSTLAASPPAHTRAAAQHRGRGSAWGYRRRGQKRSRGEPTRTSRTAISASSHRNLAALRIPCGTPAHSAAADRDRANGCKPCMAAASLNLPPRLPRCCRVRGLPSGVDIRHRSPPAEHRCGNGRGGLRQEVGHHHQPAVVRRSVRRHEAESTEWRLSLQSNPLEPN